MGIARLLGAVGCVNTTACVLNWAFDWRNWFEAESKIFWGVSPSAPAGHSHDFFLGCRCAGGDDLTLVAAVVARGKQ